MSSIFGLVYFDHNPVDLSLLEKMHAKLAHWQIDGQGLWLEANVGLGHLLLYNTPESLTEQQPYQESAYVLTADIRLDNRDELAKLLNFSKADQAKPDCFYVLRAYQRWHEQCVQYLLGDFAFALWDKQKHQLFCARDPFGCKPLYYYHHNNTFAFASEIKALFCIPTIEQNINQPWLKDLLVNGVLMTSDYTDETYYQNILRLRPAHYLIISKKSVVKKQYWDLDTVQEIVFTNENEYVEAFREQLFRAVKCRLRSYRPIGSELSGGLDSSSIVAIAAKHESSLNTFTQVSPPTSRYADESPLAQQVIEYTGVKHPYFINISSLDLDEILKRSLALFDMPIVTQYAIINVPFFEEIQKKNIGTLLMGFGGDECISGHGYEYWRELLGNQQWLLLWQAMQAEHQLYKTGNLFKKYLHFILNAKYPRLMTTYRQCRHRNNSSIIRSTDIFNENLIKELTLPSRLNTIKTLYQSFNSIRERNRQDLLSERSWHLRNRLEYLSIRLNNLKIEARFPWLDARLIKFYFAVPSSYKRRHGYGRYLLRQAMKNLLPEAIRLRTTKAGASAPATQHLLEEIYRNTDKKNYESCSSNELIMLQTRLFTLFKMLT